MDAAWFAILTTVVLAVIAGLIAHMRDDARTKERVAKLETDNAHTKDEIKSLRDRWHDMRDDLIKRIAELFGKG